MKGKLKRFSMCGGKKPRSSRCFKPGDMLIFAEEEEIAILTRRFDLYAKDGEITQYPNWCWDMRFTPGKNTPWGYDERFGALETNLYNRIGHEIEYVPVAALKEKK